MVFEGLLVGCSFEELWGFSPIYRRVEWPVGGYHWVIGVA